MKYVVVIADGAADKPIPEMGFTPACTPFQAARTPHLRALASRGRVGCAVTTPPGFGAGSDVCSMSLLGYDPVRYHTGRAPLEAAALGIPLSASDWIFRVNLVTVGESGADAGLMLDHSAGAISDQEARALVGDLLRHWHAFLENKAGGKPEVVGGARAGDLRLVPGVSYRNILVDGGAGRADEFGAGRDYGSVVTTPPHEIPRQPFAAHMPKASTDTPRARAATELLNMLISESAIVLAGHPVNRARVAAGKRPANRAWIWGQGTRPAMPAFRERFGLRGAMITPVDLLAGIAALMGWDRLEVPGMTSYHDNDYAAQGRAACQAIGKYDIVCCHVEAPDEASHQGDWKTKVAAIEAIDEHVLGPIVRTLEGLNPGQGETDVRGAGRAHGGWRLLYLPDHYTLVSTRMHDATPVPFLIAGSDITAAAGASGSATVYNETAALASTLRMDPGHTLMGYFLGRGPESEHAR